MSDTPQPVAIRNPVEALAVRYRETIEGALNNVLAWPAFIAAIKADCIQQPKLMEAANENPGSLIDAMILAAQLKLLPGSAYGLFYLIPRRMKGRMTVTTITGYKGLCELAQRHPRVHSVEAFPVYAGEEFSWNPGSAEVQHRYSWDVDRSDENIVGVYAIARITEVASNHLCDKPIIWAMSRKEIEKARGRSDAWKWAEKDGKGNSPWHTDFPMMARKTAIRALLNHGSVPRHMDLMAGFAAEDEAERSSVAVEEPDLPSGPTRGDEIAGRLGIVDAEEDQS